MACRGITTIIDQWNCNCDAGSPHRAIPYTSAKQDKMSYSNYVLCTNCTTLMYINVINVTYTYIMLHTIKPTHLMTVYCLSGAAPIGLSQESQDEKWPNYRDMAGQYLMPQKYHLVLHFWCSQVNVAPLYAKPRSKKGTVRSCSQWNSSQTLMSLFYQNHVCHIAL